MVALPVLIQLKLQSLLRLVLTISRATLAPQDSIYKVEPVLFLVMDSRLASESTVLAANYLLYSVVPLYFLLSPWSSKAPGSGCRDLSETQVSNSVSTAGVLILWTDLVLVFFACLFMVLLFCFRR